MDDTDVGGLSGLEYHVLLALAAGPLHGYALKDAVAAESGGAIAPRAGSMYRVVARLITTGLVAETAPAEPSGPHPGLPRRPYAITARGRAALAAEARRLKDAAAMAERRLRVLRSDA
jgi:DNA-binding PadR family transcriptional regulator